MSVPLQAAFQWVMGIDLIPPPFFSNLKLCVCVCMWVCTYVCRYLRRPDEGITSLGAGVTGGFELPDGN